MKNRIFVNMALYTNRNNMCCGVDINQIIFSYLPVDKVYKINRDEGLPSVNLRLYCKNLNDENDEGLTINRSSRNGHLEVVEYLHGKGRQCTVYAMDSASEYGHLKVVEYLHSIGKKCSKKAMDCASRLGHLDVVKYLHSIGKKGSTNSMDWASEKGNLKMVKYLHSIGKKCTRFAIQSARRHGYIEVVRYLQLNEDDVDVDKHCLHLSKICMKLEVSYKFIH